MSIKYYQLAKGEELPEEFCVVRDVNGEPEEYAWYEPMDSFDRELWSIFNGGDWVAASEYRKLKTENEKLLEQTELLVTLLRNDCDIEASWDGLRKFWYIGLTESGCLMRDRACKAEAENAKLRKLMARMAKALGIDCEWADPDWCKTPCVLEFGCWPEGDHMSIRCPAWAAMHELGVEVGGERLC